MKKLWNRFLALIISLTSGEEKGEINNDMSTQPRKEIISNHHRGQKDLI